MKRWIWLGLFWGLCPAILCAERPHTAIPESAIVQQDTSYEQMLRYEAGPDHIITPARVIRWMFGIEDRSSHRPPVAEFQPIVDVNQSHVRLIAAIAYKF